MDPRLIIAADIFALNSRLFRNCLAGLSDAQAQERPSGRGPTNSIAFIAAHLVDSRYYILGLLGKTVPSPLTGCEGGFNDIAKLTRYPSLAEIQSAWGAAGEMIERELAAATAAQLDKPYTDFPLALPTVLGVVSFMAQHESYHLGQLGVLRKYAGLEAMAY